MPELLTPTRKAIVRALLDAGGDGLALSDIADAVGVTSPTAHKHLELLIEEGLAERSVRERGRTRYIARDFFEATWTDREHGVLDSWRSGSVDWRFPLVTRVPDEEARRILTWFLSMATERGYFHPWLLLDEWPDPSEPAAPERYGVSMIVYGSCARGDAGATSDLDIVVLQPSIRTDISDRFEELAAEINLKADRNIQLKVLNYDQFRGLDASFRNTIRDEGITVYSTSAGGLCEETLEGGE